MKVVKAIILAVCVLLYYELRRILSGNLRKPKSTYIDSILKKKVPCSKLSFTYALSVFKGRKDSRMLLGLVQHLKKSPLFLKITAFLHYGWQKLHYGKLILKAIIL